MRCFHSLLLLLAFSSNAAAQFESPIDQPALETNPVDPYPPAETSAISPYYDSVWAKVSAGISTECKACPYSLCPNQDFYGSLYMFRASCWATGQTINGTSMWLKSEQGCYVSVQDTLRYWRNYKDDIKYCGDVPERVSSRRMTARAAAECKLCPNAQCETVRTYNRRSDVTVTCRAQALPGCLGDCLSSDIPPVNQSTVFPWLKTNHNCYVEVTALNGIRNSWRSMFQPRALADQGAATDKLQGPSYIDNCGPVPFLEASYRTGPPITTTLTVTVTVTVFQPTTIILRPPPCTTCQPLIFGYTPPMTLATLTSSDPSFPTTVIIPATVNPTTLVPTSSLPLPLTPTSSPPITLLPTSTFPINVTTSLSLPPITFSLPSDRPGTSSPGQPEPSAPVVVHPTTNPPITLTPTSSDPITLTPSKSTLVTLTSGSTTIIITLTPTSNPIITLTPTSVPIITLTPTTNPPITLIPSSNPPIIIPTNGTSNLTLPPIAFSSPSGANRVIGSIDQVTASPLSPSSKPCTCEPFSCAGGYLTQSLCSQVASSACARTCSSTTTGNPSGPLMTGTGGRPPPQAGADKISPVILASASCACPPARCPEVVVDAAVCSQIWTAGCSAACGNAPTPTKPVWDSTTVLIVTQVVPPSAH